MKDYKDNKEKKQSMLDMFSEKELKGFLNKGFFKAGYILYMILALAYIPIHNILLKLLIVAAPLMIYSGYYSYTKPLKQFLLSISVPLLTVGGMQLLLIIFKARPGVGVLLSMGLFFAWRGWSEKETLMNIYNKTMMQIKGRIK